MKATLKDLESMKIGLQEKTLPIQKERGSKLGTSDFDALLSRV